MNRRAEAAISEYADLPCHVFKYEYVLPLSEGWSDAGRTVLEGGKAGKDIFDKGELAAILRFGAENLFEEDAGDDKVKEDVQKRDQQLYEEDIDAILARAEVVDQRVEEEANDKKNDLLSAFNSVATFKNDEDDATFWNRLITDDQRATVPERKGTKATVTEVGPDGELMPRTARLRAAGSGADDKGGGISPCCRLVDASHIMLMLPVWTRILLACTPCTLVLVMEPRPPASHVADLTCEAPVYRKESKEPCGSRGGRTGCND